MRGHQLIALPLVDGEERKAVEEDGGVHQPHEVDRAVVEVNEQAAEEKHREDLGSGGQG